MNPREAEKLLGGYATGTLTESERGALFAAALEDQALFDALADEEALRELLADPAARAKLLAALEPKIVPLWRRPGAMTLAASLLVAVGAGLLLKRTKPEDLRVVPRRAPLTQEAPLAPSPAPAAPAVSEPPAAKSTPLGHRQMKRAPSAPLEMPQAAPPPPAPAPASAPVAEAQAGSVETVVGQAANADTTASTQGFALSREQAALVPKGRDVSSTAYFAPGATLGPEWAWGPVDPNYLSVRWNPQGHLYLLSRDASGAHLLEPQSSTRQADGRMLSSFFLASGSAPLDLYWLPKAVDAPTLLPAEGPVDGFRVRVRPATSPKK